MTARTPYLILKLRAMGLLLLGRRPAALEVFLEMLARYPGDAYVLSSLAHLEVQLGHTESALAYQTRLTQLHSGNAGNWFNLGFMLESQQKFAEAEQAFSTAVDIDPKLDRAWYGLGLVRIQLHRFDEAVAALKQNTQLQPMSPYGWYQLARVHVDRKEPDEARKIIRHLKGFEPKVAAQLERETGIFISPAS